MLAQRSPISYHTEANGCIFFTVGLAFNRLRLGMLFGSLFFGWISDAMGRRFAFGLCILCLSLGSTMAAVSTNYAMYMVFRFITSMGGIGSFMTSFVLATEFIGTKYRTSCGILIEIPFALGELYIVLLAYYIRDWVNLQVTI